MIGALGLDPSRRDSATHFLSARIRQDGLAPEHRAVVALLTLAIQEGLGPEARGYTNIIRETLAADGLPRAHYQEYQEQESRKGFLLDAIGEMASRAEPHVAAHVLRGIESQEDLSQVLYSMTGKLEPAESSKALADLMEEHLIPVPLYLYLEKLGLTSPEEFASGLTWISNKQGAAKVSETCEKVLEGYIATFEAPNPEDRRQEAMRAIATMLEGWAEPSVTVRLLSFSLDGNKNLNFNKLSDRDIWLASRERVSVILSNSLIVQVKRSAPHEAGKAVGQAAQLLLDALQRGTNPLARRNLSRALSMVSSCLQPVDAARVCGQAARILIAALEKEVDGQARGSLAHAIASLYVCLTEDEAVRVIRFLSKEMADDLFYSEGDGDLDLLTANLLPADANRAARVLVSAVRQETNAKARLWQLTGLAVVAGIMEPKEAAHTCGPVFSDLLDVFMRDPKDGLTAGLLENSLTAGLQAVSKSLDQPRAIQAARSLADALRREQQNPPAGKEPRQRREALSSVLASVSERMPPAEAAKMLIEALGPEKQAEVRQILAVGLATSAARMKPSEEAKAMVRVTTVLFEEESPVKRENLILSLVSLASRMPAAKALLLSERGTHVVIDPLGSIHTLPAVTTPLSALLDLLMEQHEIADAVRLGDQAAQKVLDSLAAHAYEGDYLANYLPGILTRMAPATADRVCEEVLRSLLKETRPANHPILMLFPHLPTTKCNGIAREQALLLCAGKGIDPGLLDSILTDAGRPKPTRHGTVDTTGSDDRRPMKTRPCRLSTQDLVELLKMPTCFGTARRVVLKHLGNIHGRRFVNHWEFVRFAREKGLEVDLTTPPRRPNREESIWRMLAILDRKP